jgi:hypothetical protein
MKKLNINYDLASEMLEDIIEKLEFDSNVTIVCDYELAKLISEKMEDDFTEVIAYLDEEIDEYFISVCDNTLYVEQARFQAGKFEGKYKGNDAEVLIIVSDYRDDEEIQEIIDSSSESTLSRVEIVDFDEYDLYSDEEDSDECDCDECTCGCCDCDSEVSDEVKAEASFIFDAFQKIMESNGCPNCVLEILSRFYFDSKNIGETNAKDYMRKCIEG